MRQETAQEIAEWIIQNILPILKERYLSICSETGLLEYSHRSIYKIMRKDRYFI